MSAPARIPIPPRQHWREFRLRFLPVIVFSLAVAGLAALWRNHVDGTTVTGQAEARQVTVGPSKAGLLTQLNVHRFQNVRAGDVLGEILPADPKVVAGTLALIQSKIESLRAAGAAQSAGTNDDMPVLDWLQDRSKLAMAKSSLKHVSSDFPPRRPSKEDRDGEDSEKPPVKTHEKHESRTHGKEEAGSLRHQLEARDKLIDRLESGGAMAGGPEARLRPLLALIEAELRKAEEDLIPIKLTAPMDGMVDQVSRHAGEAVGQGDAVITIAAPNPERIIGYLREPIALEPKVGMLVIVRTRGPGRKSGVAKIIDIGTQFEPVGVAFMPATRTTNTELGLPIAVSLPPDLSIRGGELLDLKLVQDSN